MSVTEIQLFQLLKAKLGDREAEYLVSYVKNEVKNEFDNKKDVLATKEDINLVKQDLHDAKAEMIKWMFIFWVGQVAVTVGIVYTFINK
ncbi:MAG: hypothetical protein EAY66_08705 [Sphingobacteriales bacterium]|nr:MAG: hypothetical protein EAY66_08705 [Sphingobacteriales bacterium]